MKKIYFLLGLISNIALAQLATPSAQIIATTNPTTGNVGIGTSSPSEKLEINGNLKINTQGIHTSIYLGNEINDAIITDGTSNKHYGGGYFFRVQNNNAPNQYTDALVLADNGNIGIGTINPRTKLDVNGTITIPEFSAINIRGNDIFHGLKYSYNNFANTFIDGPILYGWSGGALGIKKEGGESIALKWNESGNVVISNKLEAKEIKVTESPTADFVFEEDYKLPTLQEVEQHIKEKKHLPEIASAKQMEKEGVNIGEFQIQLLQKIEELTLYIIEQNKTLIIQNEKMAQQEKRIEELEKNN